MALRVTSTAFGDGDRIPAEHTCRGAGTVPPLEWSGVPENAQSVALVVSDPDAPRGTFLHWVLYDIPSSTTRLAEIPPGAREAANSAGRISWYPPCPPRGTHRYVFTVYALSSAVRGSRDAGDVLPEIERLALDRGTLTGTVSA